MKPRFNKSRKSAAKQALANVLAAAKAASNDETGLCLYDCVVWLLYACCRADARGLAMDSEDSTLPKSERRELKKHTPRSEIDDTVDAMNDDHHAAAIIYEDAAALAKVFDPGYAKPILKQPEW